MVYTKKKSYNFIQFRFNLKEHLSIIIHQIHHKQLCLFQYIFLLFNQIKPRSYRKTNINDWLVLSKSYRFCHNSYKSTEYHLQNILSLDKLCIICLINFNKKRYYCKLNNLLVQVHYISNNFYSN